MRLHLDAIITNWSSIWLYQGHQNEAETMSAKGKKSEEEEEEEETKETKDTKDANNTKEE